MPLLLKQLLKDYIPPDQRPEFAWAIAELQGLTAGGAGQQDPEEQMDLSGSHISPSEASRSEGRSETRSALELEAVEHMLFNYCSETLSEKNE